ncbi:MAG: efflux RND transporter periplasmic adaptor subunit [Myxococcales bacterium]|nr:efflux RND transporter periplasmic adaptor subunit [Myxococcales bacterium]
MTRTHALRRGFGVTALALALATLSLACDGGEKDSGLPPARSGAEAPKPRIKQSATAAAATDDAERHVGKVLPIASAQIGPKASGTIARISVEEGDRVKKGDFLFSLDARAQRLGITQAKTGLKSAILARDEAKRALDRQQRLKERGSISQASFEQVENAYKAAENGVKQAEVSVSLAKRQTFDSSVVAPFDGIITQKLKTVGETVTMMPPTTVLVLQDHSTLELRVDVPEAALRTLEAGKTIVADFPAIGISRSAVIERVMPTVDPVTRTVEIVAHISNKDALIKPGMYVEISSDAFERPQAATEDAAAAGDDNPDLSLKPGALAKAAGDGEGENES